MLEEIRKNINNRMSHYTHSGHPTDDEVSMAWLLCYIDDLEADNFELSEKE